jgi:hypothetical protein
MRSAFLLLGKEESSVRTWHQLKVHTAKAELQTDLGAIDPSVVSLGERTKWRAAKKSIKGLDVNLAWKKGSKARGPSRARA